MTGVSITLTPDGAAAWARAPELVADRLLTAITEAQFLLYRETVERTPVGVGGGGGLRGSIQAPPPEVAGARIEATVGSALVYAAPVELGTRPHMPPVAAIRQWVEHRLGLSGKDAESAAWGIAMAIRKRGTKGARMFGRALEATEAQLRAILEVAAADVAATLGQGGTP